MQLQVLSLIPQEVFPGGLSQYLSNNPSSHYKVYKIPKRTLGFRVIAQPTPELKYIQRLIVEKIKPHVQIHSSAKAYVENINIKDNASVHVKSNYLLKMDFENFFNSLTPPMLLSAIKLQNINLVAKEIEPLMGLLFWNRTKKKKPNLILSVGAPCSPFLSNLIMYNFDKVVTDKLSILNINYSRYADDLTFSTSEKDKLFEIPAVIESVLYELYGGKLKINHSKTVFSSKAHNRHVTGITLTNNNKLSLGRERKRYIRALLHKFSTQSLKSEEDIAHLKGLVGFVKTVEPDFLKKMKTRYGNQVFVDLFKYGGNN
ncbi:retron St85 family RNA-directed DNA polymerase [Shewanella algae]|uniref:retron St85 family RNA-directed DNA polymerase n=1 Tax=Shewanella algae TaxID=38313 RepID=UPI0031F47C50